MMKYFPLNEGVTTRQVNRTVRTAIRLALTEFSDRLPSVESNEELRRDYGGMRRYIFGIGVPGLRDTLVAHYEPNSGEIGVVFPNNYQSWDRASVYDQLRVRAYDLIVHHSDLRDKSRPGLPVSGHYDPS